MCITLQKFKIELARSFNKIYNSIGVTPEQHRKAWKEIQESCAYHGISTDLIQVDKNTFEFLVQKNVVNQYFL